MYNELAYYTYVERRLYEKEAPFFITKNVLYRIGQTYMYLLEVVGNLPQVRPGGYRSRGLSSGGAEFQK